jgi:hypothetical protein
VPRCGTGLRDTQLAALCIHNLGHKGQG